MRIENQVAPFKFAMALQELGYPQYQSSYYWVENQKGEVGVSYFANVNASGGSLKPLCAAPTAAEMLHEVGQFFVLREGDRFVIYKMPSLITAQGVVKVAEIVDSSTAATALCRCLLWQAQKGKLELNMLTRIDPQPENPK